jgi:hypothetical protein
MGETIAPLAPPPLGYATGVLHEVWHRSNLLYYTIKQMMLFRGRGRNWGIRPSMVLTSAN